MTALRRHWPEYAIEAGALATFMVSATFCATLLQHPGSPVAHLVPASPLGRVPMAIAMGLTAMAIIYSPLGRRSGAHMNPAVTLTFLRLGKIAPADAAGYVVAQCAGGMLGTLAALVMLAGLPADPSVNFIATTPGSAGAATAFLAEAAMSFVLMLTVLTVSNHPTHARFAGLSAATLIALYIVVESPLSGMSMNPARTFGPALLAHTLDSLWVYLTAPVLGMLAAAELFVYRNGSARGPCAKLHHPTCVR